MSFTDPGVQPEGQGAATGDTPYAEYLSRIPEEHRGLVEPVFKEWDGNVTKRFQEHSQFRQQWEPYQQAGLDQYDPQSLAGLIEFSRLSESPDRLSNEAYKAWVEQEAQQFGFGAQQDDEFDPDLIDPGVQQLLDQRTAPLQQKLEQMEQQWQKQQQAQQQQQIASQLEQQFDALQREHGELDRDVIERFAGPYVSEDPQNAMKRAFEDMQKFRAGIEQQLLRSKMGGPGVPQSGGPANPAEPVPTSLKDAQQAFIERRQAASSM